MTQDRRVAVIGLGYVGLPLAISFIEAGLEVEGIDALPARVRELNDGHSPIDDVSDERLRAALDAGLRVTSPDGADPKNADACVLRTTSSPERGVRKSTTWLAAADSVNVFRRGAFSHHTPASDPSSA